MDTFNILVIGNGFDIAHGLPTKYVQFLEFAKEFQQFDSDSLGKESPFFEYFRNTKANNPDLYKELKLSIAKNCWIDFFIEKADQLKKAGKETWIDFEKEISDVVQALDDARNSFKDQANQGKSELKMNAQQWNILGQIFTGKEKMGSVKQWRFSQDTIIKRKKQLIEALDRLTRSLEIYLSDYISYESCPRFKDIADLNIDMVLSFNYTDTYSRIYESKSFKQIRYDYIHGKAKAVHEGEEECNLVLGIDEYLSPELRDTDNEFIQFKKFYQRIFKGTGSRYIDWLQERRNNKELFSAMDSFDDIEMNVYIYGHSLNITDRDILRDLILEDGAQTVVFYHNKEALGDQIANLVKVIGEEELIHRTSGSNGSIKFKQSSKETVGDAYPVQCIRS